MTSKPRLIQPDGDEPLFRQLEALIRRQIQSGELQANDRLPSLSELCELHHVSAITIRRAINDLIREGLLTGVQGKGVYVSAKPPRSQTSAGLIGLVIPDLANTPFFGGIHQGVEAELIGQRLVVASSKLDVDLEIDLLRDLHQRGIRDILITPVTGNRPASADSAIRELISAGCRLVCIDRHFNAIDTDRVTSDNVGIGRAAGEHLINLGHRRIGFIYAHQCTTFDGRQAGLAEALSAAGHAIDPELIRGGWSAAHDYQEAGYLHALELFHHPRPPTAIIAGNDLLALGILKAAHLVRSTIPDQLSLVGVDDLAGSAHTAPPLTTVRQDTTAMGRIAAQLLRERMDGFTGPSRISLVAGQLILRASTSRMQTT